MHMQPVITQRTGSRWGDCLNVVRLPGRLDGRQAGTLLGFQPHDIPILIAAKLLQPLGKPVANSPKYFAACVVEELRSNPEWLDRATRAVTRHWQVKNGKKPFPSASEFDDQRRALAARN